MHISVTKVSLTLQFTKVRSLKHFNKSVVMHAIICIVDFMNFMNFVLFIIKFIKFKPIIKFKKFELHNYADNYRPY